MPFWKLYYHFVWSTKNRLGTILPEFEDTLYKVITAKIKDFQGTLFAIGGTEDHIHILVSLPPKLSPSAFIGELKGNSSHFVNSELKPDLDFRWQEEYGVLSFSEKNLPGLVKYVKNQREHHASGNLVSEMEMPVLESPGDKSPG